MIAATSWFLTTLTGLGLPFAVWLGGADARRQWRQGQDLATLLALALMLGLLADHAAGLLTGRLDLQDGLAWAGGVLLAGGLALIALRGSAGPMRRMTLSGVVAVLAIAVLALAIYAAPLLEWDARSIWFFHGKAIFFDGGLKAAPFWNNPAYAWSHPDYPELLPMLAARYGAFAGVWNEFVPKGALAPVAAAGILALLALRRSEAAFIILAAVAMTVLGASLWNGYMDGWIALFAAVAALATGAWMETGRRTHLAFCAAALGIALCIKNEGQLLTVASLPALLWAVAARRRTLAAGDAAVLLAWVPFALWLVVKAKLAVHGDLEGEGLLRRAVAVATDPHELTYRLTYLAHKAFTDTHLFAALGAFLAVGICVGFRTSALVCGLSGALYAGGLVMVYLGTPQDFVWHVGTSLDRVLMAPTLLFLSGLSTMIPDILQACRQAASPPVS